MKIEKGVLFMKKVKKIIVSFLLMCMLCVGMTCVASATAAEFRFSDPQTSVGAEVDVTAKVSSAKALNTIQATLSYDKTKLRFISGDDATGGDGTITTISSTAKRTSAIITTISKKLSTKFKISPQIPFPLLTVESDVEYVPDDGEYFWYVPSVVS